MALQLRVLGPLEASSDAAPIALGGRKPRALLARLALEANRTVAVQRLIDDLWGEQVPDSAGKMVQIYVSQLRKVLPEGVLHTRAPGYLIELEPEAVDSTRFRTLHREGRAALAAGDAETAAERLQAALALWRGPALAEFAEPFARVEGAHLEELRLVCLEERIEADLARGLHADVAGELEALVARHPLRESLHAQLILALYRAGRQAEALAAYERFRRGLDDELGIEPSATLKALQHRILNQHPSLELLSPAADGAAAVPPRTAERLIGRADELARLGATLEAAAGGAGTTVLVSGPAGIGKTRLAEELAGRASAAGGTVLAGRCIQLVGTGLPYLPLVEAMRPIRDALEPGELARLVADVATAPTVARTGSKLALFQEVVGVLERLGAGRPVLFVLEDLQWADESTLDLVAFLAHAVPGRRILVVGTYRSDEVRPSDPLHRLAAGLTAGGRASALAVGPLAPADVRALLAQLPAAQAAAIAARSEGNPFFARELAAAAAQQEADLPPALRDVLLGHVARVDADGRAVLRVLAAAGRDVSYRLLAAVMPLDELALAGALRQAFELDIVVPDQATGAFRFRHALFAEAIYATLLPGEREVLHERLARALTDEPRLAASGAAAAEAAQHWAAAGRPVEALAASLQAAREAEAVSGLTEALMHVERVLALWDQVPEAEELSGVALPAVLAWATELAGLSHREEVEPDTPLAVAEARRLYPSVVVLESLAVRQTPPFDEAELAALRAANDRLRDAAGDPAAAIAADDDFHRRLTARCGNEHLLRALDPIRRALLRYERVYMREPARVERSVAQHAAIVEALERGDHADAAQRLRENLSGGLPDLREVLEPPCES